MIAKIKSNTRTNYTKMFGYRDYLGNFTPWNKMSISNGKRIHPSGIGIGRILNYSIKIDYIEDTVTINLLDDKNQNWEITIYESLTDQEIEELQFGKQSIVRDLLN